MVRVIFGRATKEAARQGAATPARPVEIPNPQEGHLVSQVIPNLVHRPTVAAMISLTVQPEAEITAAETGDGLIAVSLGSGRYCLYGELAVFRRIADAAESAEPASPLERAHAARRKAEETAARVRAVGEEVARVVESLDAHDVPAAVREAVARLRAGGAA